MQISFVKSNMFVFSQSENFDVVFRFYIIACAHHTFRLLPKNISVASLCSIMTPYAQRLIPLVPHYAIIQLMFHVGDAHRAVAAWEIYPCFMSVDP